MENFMKRAVKLAIENVRDGGQPFGAVLVKNGEVLGDGGNELHMKYDISGHAELLAVRRAQEYLQTNDLSGTTMYASGFPCPMCFAAMHFAGVERVYYCASLEEAKSVGLGKSAVIYEDLQKEPEERVLPMVSMELEEEIENPMILWGDFNKRNLS